MGRLRRKLRVGILVVVVGGFLFLGCEEQPRAEHSERSRSLPTEEPRASADSIRSILDGATFRSEEKRETGMSPDGAALGYWHLTFQDGAFRWLHSDVAETGSYRVSTDGHILATFRGKTVRIPHDNTVTRVRWKGMWYTRMTDRSQ